jgi:hypothetical protein
MIWHPQELSCRQHAICQNGMQRGGNVRAHDDTTQGACVPASSWGVVQTPLTQTSLVLVQSWQFKPPTPHVCDELPKAQ